LSGIGGDKSQAGRGGEDYWIVKINSNGTKQWDKRFGGTDNDDLSRIQQTTDGGFILAGTSRSGISGDKTQGTRGSYDYWIVKIDSNGIKQWDKRFGGSSEDFLFDLQKTADRGYILGGGSPSPISGDKSQAGRGGNDYWIVKIDSNGTKQWDKRFGGTDYDALHSLQQTKDGGYILGGYSFSGIGGDKTQASQGGPGDGDFWVVKVNANGVKQWDKRFGGTDGDYLYSVQQTNDSGYILGGESYSGISGDKTQDSRGGPEDMWVVKIDANGTKQWDKRYGGNFVDRIYSLQQTSDGGFILGGNSNSDSTGDKTQASWGGYDDYWIVKTDANGVAQWDARFGGTNTEQMSGLSLQQTIDNGYIIGGKSISPLSGDKTQDNRDPTNNTYDYWVVKVAPASTCANATNLTTTNITSTSATLNWTASVNPTQWQIQYRKDTGVTWTNIFRTGSMRSVPISSITTNQKYNWHIRAKCGTTLTAYSSLKSFTTLSALQVASTQSTSLSDADIEKSSALRLYPNPTKGNFVIDLHMPQNISANAKIELINMMGQAAYRETASISNGKLQKSISMPSWLSQGVYVIKVIVNGKVYVAKLIYQK
jgi:hypothetical protein